MSHAARQDATYRREDVAIMVPVYTPQPTPDENISLRHLHRWLRNYPTYLLAPEGLDVTPFRDGRDDLHVVRFPAACFRSRQAFSRLLLTAELYRAFAQHTYLLQYQLDCLVFRDDLLAWCAREYDYIGAPWLGPPTTGRASWAVGNGGFSLRHIPAALRVLTARPSRLPARLLSGLAAADQRWHVLPDRWIRRAAPLDVDLAALPDRPRPHGIAAERRRLFWRARAGAARHLRPYVRNEDLFWSVEACGFDAGFRVAPPEDAIHFAFETQPRRCFDITGGQLPFGCHAWPAYDRCFWEPHLL